jgi:hypothetical protein
MDCLHGGIVEFVAMVRQQNSSEDDTGGYRDGNGPEEALSSVGVANIRGVHTEEASNK